MLKRVLISELGSNMSVPLSSRTRCCKILGSWSELTEEHSPSMMELQREDGAMANY
jgi:hypothetical protein